MRQKRPWAAERRFSSSVFYAGSKRRSIMKKIAPGLVTAAAVFTAAPAMAQIGFYAGPGGVGVGVGAPGPYYRCAYDYPSGDHRYNDYYGPAPPLCAAPACHHS